MRNVFEYYNEDDYLAHWGIKGQKWGVRRFQNPDGSLTPEGKARYGRINQKTAQPKIHKIFNTVKYNEDPSKKVFSELHADPKYLKQAEDVWKKDLNVQKEVTKEVNNMFAGLRSSENLHVYEAAAEIAAAAQYARDTNTWFKPDVDDFTLVDVAQLGFHAVLEDGQQSDINPYSMYVAKNNLQKQVVNLGRRAVDSVHDSQKEAESIISKGLSEVNADNLTVYPKNPNYKLPNRLALDIRYRLEKKHLEDTSGRWYLGMAERASTITKEDKRNIDKAERYVRKLDKATDQNTWWYVAEAAENLGMNSTTLKNMSQSDWDRINAEIRKLRAAGK